MFRTNPIHLEKVVIYEPSASPVLEKVLIWSLLGLIWSLLDLIWALLVLIWALLNSIWSLLNLIWPYWALFGLDS